MRVRSDRRNRRFSAKASPIITHLGNALLNGGVLTSFISNSAVTFNARTDESYDRVIIGGVISTTAGSITDATIFGQSMRIVANAAGDGGRQLAIFAGRLPQNERGAGNFASNVFPVWIQSTATFGAAQSVVVLWEALGLSRFEEINFSSSQTAIDTVRAVDLRTISGGVAIAIGINDVDTANSCTWTGDQSPTEVADAAIGTDRYSACHVSGTNDDAANTITSTWAVISTTGVGVLGASFR